MGEAAMGNFGVGQNFAKEAAELLSSSDITSHCTLTTRGVIPDISANTMKSSLMALNPNPQEIMERIGVQQTVTSGTVETERARGEMQARTQSGDYIKSMGKELGKLDDANNQAFDTQTLMTAFTDYIAKC